MKADLTETQSRLIKYIEKRGHNGHMAMWSLPSDLKKRNVIKSLVKKGAIFVYEDERETKWVRLAEAPDKLIVEKPAPLEQEPFLWFTGE